MSDYCDTDPFAEMQAKLLRSDFNLFAKTALAPLGMTPARHHRLLNAKLQGVADGKIDRLMVLMPPGSAKSTYCSQLFPPWALAQPSVSCMITASAGISLMEDFLEKAARFHASMQDILGYDLTRATLTKWNTSTGKELRSFGALSDTAGRRADIAIIDDPFGSWADAQSQTKRDDIWNWYSGDIVNRLKAGGRIILVNTHWHEDDLSGRLMAKMAEGGRPWDIVKMQAIYDGTVEDPLGRQIGEALWPENEDVDALALKRAENGPMKWEALFQQNPVPAGGLLFKVDQIRVVDPLDPPRSAFPPGPYTPAFVAAPDRRKSVRHWDIAATEAVKGSLPDWTVGLKLTDVGRKWVVEDVKRVRLSVAGVRDLVLKTAQADGRNVRISLPQDPGAAGKFLVSDLVGLLAGFPVTAARFPWRRRWKWATFRWCARRGTRRFWRNWRVSRARNSMTKWTRWPAPSTCCPGRTRAVAVCNPSTEGAR